MEQGNPRGELPLSLSRIGGDACICGSLVRTFATVHRYKKYLASWRQSLFCKIAINFTRSNKSGLLDSSLSEVWKSEQKSREISSYVISARCMKTMRDKSSMPFFSRCQQNWRMKITRESFARLSWRFPWNGSQDCLANCSWNAVIEIALCGARKTYSRHITGRDERRGVAHLKEAIAARLTHLRLTSLNWTQINGRVICLTSLMKVRRALRLQRDAYVLVTSLSTRGQIERISRNSRVGDVGFTNSKETAEGDPESSIRYLAF